VVGVPSIDPIVEKLAGRRKAFFRAADTIPAETMEQQTKSEEWSAAELVAHLVMVERAVVGGADRITQKTPKEIPFRKTVSPAFLAGGIAADPAKSPLPAGRRPPGKQGRDVGGVASRAERTLSFLEETQQRD